LWFEELIDIAEDAGSSGVFPILKRVDERHVTMSSYDTPVFVEDMVRSVAERLRGDHSIDRFVVTAENQESIHNHQASARIKG
jgi:GTP cyclohydrolase I